MKPGSNTAMEECPHESPEAEQRRGRRFLATLLRRLPCMTAYGIAVGLLLMLFIAHLPLAVWLVVAGVVAFPGPPNWSKLLLPAMELGTYGGLLGAILAVAFTIQDWFFDSLP